ncbi:hypothetical protein HGB07_00160 [Candidatus Roizmanbacteria bacterium]|nr:hypothetical protein [Candidatus Roizmanbacteria bacterium]
MSSENLPPKDFPPESIAFAQQAKIVAGAEFQVPGKKPQEADLKALKDRDMSHIILASKSIRNEYWNQYIDTQPNTDKYVCPYIAWQNKMFQTFNDPKFRPFFREIAPLLQKGGINIDEPVKLKHLADLYEHYTKPAEADTLSDIKLFINDVIETYAQHNERGQTIGAGQLNDDLFKKIEWMAVFFGEPIVKRIRKEIEAELQYRINGDKLIEVTKQPDIFDALPPDETQAVIDEYITKNVQLKTPENPMPILHRTGEITRRLHSHDVLLVEAGLGTGKSTGLIVALPQMLGRPGGRVFVSEPRKTLVDNLTLKKNADGTAKLRDNYARMYKGEKKNRETAQFVYGVEGSILNWMKHHDPLLLGIDEKYYPKILSGEIEPVVAFVADEFHEGNKLSHALLARIIEAQAERKKLRDLGYPELKIIMASATIDSEQIVERINGMKDHTDQTANFIRIEGAKRQYEDQSQQIFAERSLTTEERKADLVKKAIEFFTTKKEGDFMAFVPGITMSENLVKEIVEKLKQQGIDIEGVAIHGKSTQETRSKLTDKPENRLRRFFCGTNTIEAGATPANVQAGYDMGLANVKFLDEETGVEYLKLMNATRRSLDQRWGRFGRSCPGILYCGYTEAEYNNPNIIPRALEAEMNRTEFTDIALRLLADGYNIDTFKFIDPPTDRQKKQAREALVALGALNNISDNTLTPLGEDMAWLPLDPNMARMFIEAKKLGATEPALWIMSIMSSGTLFYDVQQFSQELLDGIKGINSDVILRYSLIMEYMRLANDPDAQAEWCIENNLYQDTFEEVLFKFQEYGHDLADELPKKPDPPKTRDDMQKAINQMLVVGYADKLLRRTQSIPKKITRADGTEVEVADGYYNGINRPDIKDILLGYRSRAEAQQPNNVIPFSFKKLHNQAQNREMMRTEYAHAIDVKNLDPVVARNLKLAA